MDQFGYLLLFIRCWIEFRTLNAYKQDKEYNFLKISFSTNGYVLYEQILLGNSC